MPELTRKLRIVFVTVADFPDGGGRTSRLRTLVLPLVKMGHEVQFWNEHGMLARGTVPGSEVAGEFSGTSFEYVLGQRERGYGFGSFPTKVRAVWVIARKLAQAHRGRKIDLVVFNNLAFHDTYPLTVLARRRQIPTAQCYEDERLEIVSRASLGCARRLFGLNAWLADHWCSRMADAIITISTYLQDKYARLSGHPERVFLIPTIIDCESWACVEEAETGCPRILYSGGFAEQDELEKVFEALARLRRRNAAFQMVLAGAHPNHPRARRLRELARQLRLEDSVEMKGYVPLERVKEEICRANILLAIRRDTLWSRSGLSTKLSEYLASGRAVITSNVGDTARYVTDGESALFVHRPDDPEEIAAVLGLALASPELRREIGRKGRQAAIRHFDTAVAMQLWEKVLVAVIHPTSLQPNGLSRECGR